MSLAKGELSQLREHFPSKSIIDLSKSLRHLDELIQWLDRLRSDKAYTNCILVIYKCSIHPQFWDSIMTMLKIPYIVPCTKIFMHGEDYIYMTDDANTKNLITQMIGVMPASCHICCEKMDSYRTAPVCLECGFSMCQTCLDKLSRDDACRCPFCRQINPILS